ncbi:acyltransferase [Actinoplanes sp. NPDC023801]|uniref:acyltransferase family protein n=1 Tax=Actinoplanes sp. NPDC023801 TaxID=3154595 RepID=UPI00340612C8
MRNRYLDTLRAAAIVRVVVYHHFGWAWLAVVFPATGVMFAVAGSLTAASLERRPAGRVVTSRLRRLLPPVWLFGLVAVPAMLWSGWSGEPGGQHPFRPADFGFWLLPLGDPPAGEKAAFAGEVLRYVRTYLWFVLLSPLLYPLFRRVGWPLLAVPLVGMALLESGDSGMPAAIESACRDLTTFGACWLAGFAHRDGRLRRLHPALTVLAALALGGLGLYWLARGPAGTGWDLGEAPGAQAVYSLGAVLLLLRWEPAPGPPVLPPVAKLVSGLNSRAVTICLWHGAAIAAARPVMERTGLDGLGRFEEPAALVVAVALTAVPVALFGWAEDLAARRRPRLWPVVDDAATGLAPPDPRPAAAGGAELPRPGITPAPAPRAGDRLPAGWPEIPRPAMPGREVATQRITSHRLAGDMPVAGRRPAAGPGVPRPGRHGAPWAGFAPPAQPDAHPLPLRFTGPDETP